MRRFFTFLLIAACVSPVGLAQKKTPSFWDRVIRFFGVSATPGSQRGIEDKIGAGDLWVYNVITRDSDEFKAGAFRSPVFLPNEKAILVLMGDSVVKMPVHDPTSGDGSPGTALTPETIATVPGIQKLVGIEKDSPDKVLVMIELDGDNCPAVGVLSLADGTVTKILHEGREDDLTLLSHLRDWDRVYEDGTKFEIRLKSKGNGTRAEWTEVWLKLKSKDWINVSRCDGPSCGQPTISDDRNLVVFVRSKQQS